ncbi:fumarylacetoacetate hydrolase family protein [Streptomyces caelestis]|uniref:2-keto-4-pentenoate hydratase/2-oxohepta-3-ene-1,7-dioic acid hydratase in catechol pathway n=1 Tax=Streptomyces caelestis TaxID=36816 RepID=A0A7W9GZ75_9ACTN|nr:fumarylacetoacetate hydrolase family protein [Streptomyces caelestis]MBB5792720.1 2-keto-4-pentenoate hydratase/2-oxohepta-3-ene-1,7-dioic acid hydratase in catechol pathway [Streptomyces caelestis]GGW82029.1 hydrolase [Streptomyces caelestis]
MTSAATSAPFTPFSGPFAIGTLSAPGETRFPGLVAPDGQVLDLRTALDEPALTTLALLERWDEELPRLHTLAGDPTGDWRPLAEMAVHAPVEPRQIFQSGANYRQHVIDLAVAHRAPDAPGTVEEARAEVAAVMDKRAAEDLPYVFIGLPTTISGPYDDVVLPAWAEKPDWELELAAVISRPAYRVSVEEALEYVAGYTIANDLTDRASVFRRDMPPIGTDWLRSKNAPGFTPLGPWIVPAGSIADPSDLQVTLKLNGETMQDESTSDMIFGVARLVSYISQTARLLPGDLVLTGSPAGNGIHWGRLLRDGDVMDGSVTGLGTQRTRCVAEEDR